MDFIIMLVMTALLQCTSCNPPPEDIKIPVPVSSPAEINNLYHDTRNINQYRDVAPLGDFKPRDTLEHTIKEVEDLIKSNPKLPRLTRGEIIDILENITDTDTLQVKNLNKTRADGQRAIMVVMPFTAGSVQGDIKDLYTRAPVTHMIGEEVPKTELKTRKKPSRRKPPSFPTIDIEDDQSNLIAFTSNKDNNINLQPPPTTTTTTTTAAALEYTTKSTILNNHEVVVTQEPMKTATIRWKQTQKYSNHRYPTDEVTTISSDNGIRLISPPVFNHYDDKYSIPYTLKLQPNPADLFVNKMVQTTQKTIIDDIVVPDDFKSVIEDLDMLHKPNFNKINMVMPNPVREEIAISPPPSTTKNPMPDFSEAIDNLSPDMKDLLMNFGLLENPNKKPEPVMPEESAAFVQNAEVKPESYLSFRPLPDDTSSRQDMDDFLAKFGLGRQSARSQKAIAMNKPPKELEKNPQLNLDVVPESLQGVIQDLGFTTKNVKTMTTDTPKHSFNPTTQNATEEELGRLSKLLSMIKDLDKMNNNITEENLKNIDVNALKDLIDSFNVENFVPLNKQGAPNPLNYDYKVVKSDFKRQENTTTTTSTTATSTTAASTTSTEEPRNPSLEDLEASFGGLPETPVTTTEVVTTTRRSGFYYLVDWNTLLDVDDQNGRRVNLRFQPKVGDPKNFRYVTVP